MTWTSPASRTSTLRPASASVRPTCSAISRVAPCSLAWATRTFTALLVVGADEGPDPGGDGAGEEQERAEGQDQPDGAADDEAGADHQGAEHVGDGEAAEEDAAAGALVGGSGRGE